MTIFWCWWSISEDYDRFWNIFSEIKTQVWNWYYVFIITWIIVTAHKYVKKWPMASKFSAFKCHMLWCVNLLASSILEVKRCNLFKNGYFMSTCQAVGPQGQIWEFFENNNIQNTSNPHWKFQKYIKNTWLDTPCDIKLNVKYAF